MLQITFAAKVVNLAALSIKVYRLTRDCTVRDVPQVAFSLTVVNLAAPYAMLTALPADKALQLALKKAGVQYVAKTLQVLPTHAYIIIGDIIAQSRCPIRCKRCRSLSDP